MRALITGGSGFLGTCLIRHLRDRGVDIVAPSSRDADLRASDALDRWRGERFERIYHLAAWTQAGDFCLTHPGEQWLINQQINTTVLRFWAEAQPQAKLVSIGTSCAYEEGSDLREEEYLTGTPIADLYTYAMTKRMLLIGQQSLSQQFGLRWLTVVPSTLYGPGYHLGSKQMHFIFDLAWKILAHKHHGAPIVLWGDGQQRRELVFIDDFVEALQGLDDLGVENEIVNLGAGEDHSIAEFAALLCSLLGIDPSVVRYDADAYVGARSKRLNIEKLERLLPDWRRLSLRAGLDRMLTWMEPQFRTKTHA